MGAPAPLLRELFFVALKLVIVLFAILWTSINFYNYFPLSQQLLESIVARLRPARLASTGTARESVDVVEESAGPVESEGLPSITILVPAYDEADVIRNSIASIYEAEYPRELLTVYALVEPDDEATRRALADLSREFPHETVVVPEWYPGEPNKPRAINYGFEDTTSEIVGVVDAEVILGPGLLHQAASALDGGADFALSHLDMVNEDDGWLNLLFRAEYGYWYEDVLPAFTSVDYPIPLGGTSCFFRREVLEELSQQRQRERGPPWPPSEREWLTNYGYDGVIPWDPENVTEDFELGLYLWTNGYEFAYLDGVTQEESPLKLHNWMEQRTRWKKGKLFTFRQYREHPPETLWQRFHVYWQSLLPHLGPLNVAGLVLVFWLGTMTGPVESAVLEGLLALGLTFVLAVSVLFAHGYWTVSDKPPLTRLRRACVVGLSLFVYWILQWIADVRALVQTYRGEFTWVKTDHFGRNAVSESAEETAVGANAGDSVLAPATTDGGNPPNGSHTVSRTRRVGALVVLLAIAVLIRLYGLTRWSLWLDEVYTISFRASIPIRDAVMIPYDPHPPLYFVLLHLWMDVGGHTHAVAGLFSVTFSVATVAMTYLFAKRLYEDRTALVAAGLVSLSTLHIHFGRTVRMYSLLTFLALASWYAFVHLNRESRWYSAVYLVSTAAMLYTHVYAIFGLFAQQVYVILTETEAPFHRRWFRLQVLVGAIYSPWLAVLGWQVLGRFTGQGSAAIGWIPEPSTALLRDTLLMFSGFPSFYPVYGGSSLTWAVALVLLFVFNVVLLLSIIAYQPTDGDQYEYVLTDIDQASLLGVFFLVPIVVPFVASYLLFPIYFPRYTLVASLPFFILIARGLRNLRYHRGWQTGLVAVIVVAAVVSGAGYYGGESVEDWRGTVNGFEDDVERGDLLVVQPFWVEDQVRYYYDGPSVPVVTLPAEAGRGSSEIARAVNQSTDAETIWVVRYQQPAGDVSSSLNETHELVQMEHDGVLAVYQYRNTGPNESVDSFAGDTTASSTDRPESPIRESVRVNRIPPEQPYAATLLRNPFRMLMAVP